MGHRLIVPPPVGSPLLPKDIAADRSLLPPLSLPPWDVAVVPNSAEFDVSMVMVKVEGKDERSKPVEADSDEPRVS